MVTFLRGIVLFAMGQDPAGEVLSSWLATGRTDVRVGGVLHLTVRAVAGINPFSDPRLADMAWRRLRRAFPDAVAACLMPDHLHLIAPGRVRIRRSLSRILSGAALEAGLKRVWLPPGPGVPIIGVEKLRRGARYTHLNPCRAKLVADPLAWPWSTHRDAVNLTHSPWVTPTRLARVLGESAESLPQRFHAYVSGDPSVNVAGTALPQVAPPRQTPEIPLGQILAAATVATRWSGPTARRQAQVLLARHQGWTATSHIAAAIGVSTRTIRRLSENEDPDLLARAAMCLGDPRLSGIHDGQSRIVSPGLYT